MAVVVVAIGAGDEDGPPGPDRGGIVVLRRQAEEVLPACAGHCGDQHEELHAKEEEEEEEATTRHGQLLGTCWSERKRKTAMGGKLPACLPAGSPPPRRLPQLED